MTASTPPPGDAVGPEQEAIWEAPADDERAEGADDDPTQQGITLRASRGLTESITSTARSPGPAGLYYADVPNRIIAMVIDIIALSLVGVLLAMLFGGLVTQPGALDSAGGELDVVPFLIVFVLQLAVSFAYFGYLWTALRGTLGMRLLSLRIGDEADGAPIVWRQAIVRWLILGVPSMLGSLGAFVPSLIGVGLTIVGFAWLAALLYTIAGSPTKQGFHDRYAHTIVIRAGRRAA